MIGTDEKRAHFESAASPHLEGLLQLSLWLTKNGRAAASLLRETTVDTYHSTDKSMPEDSCDVRFHDILITRCAIGNQQQANTTRVPSGDSVDAPRIRGSALSAAMCVIERQQSWLLGGSGDEPPYLAACAGLPAVCRPAMILSYLEQRPGATMTHSDLMPSRAIEPMLSCGRRFSTEHLFAHLVGDDECDAVADRGEATA